MNVKQAREELEQYVQVVVYECPGWQWHGYIQRHHSDVNGPVTSRTWDTPYGQDVHRTSCQLGDRLPDPKDYAAQVNWNRMMRKRLATEPTWRTDTWPAPVYDPKPHCSGLPGGELGVKFVKALRATGPDWERDVLRDWRRPAESAVKAKRPRKVKEAVCLA